jgi:hypothetical protein
MGNGVVREEHRGVGRCRDWRWVVVVVVVVLEGGRSNFRLRRLSDDVRQRELLL